MNSVQFEQFAFRLIENREPTNNKRLHLCHFNGCLQCLPSKHTKDPHPVFTIFNVASLERGFIPEWWARLGRDLLKYYKKNPSNI